VRPPPLRGCAPSAPSDSTAAAAAAAAASRGDEPLQAARRGPQLLDMVARQRAAGAALALRRGTHEQHRRARCGLLLPLLPLLLLGAPPGGAGAGVSGRLRTERARARIGHFVQAHAAGAARAAGVPARQTRRLPGWLSADHADPIALGSDDGCRGRRS